MHCEGRWSESQADTMMKSKSAQMSSYDGAHAQIEFTEDAMRQRQTYDVSDPTLQTDLFTRSMDRWLAAEIRGT